MMAEKRIVLAIRYILRQGDGYWEVRTPETIEQHASLRSFQTDVDLTHLASCALAEPGAWVEITRLKDREGEA